MWMVEKKKGKTLDLVARNHVVDVGVNLRGNMIWLDVVSAPWSELDENKRRISVLDVRDRQSFTFI